MKIFLGLMAGFTLMLAACSTDLDVAADYEEVMVVYGLLDPKEPVQYIRVQKAYLDQERSALDFSDNPDSLFYPIEDLSVKLVKISNGDTISLSPIKVARDGNGDFGLDSNIIYTTSTPLSASENYRLVVRNLVSGKLVTAESPIVDTIKLERPPADESIDFPINFVIPEGNNSFRPVEVRWVSAKDAKAYDVVLRFWYEQWPLSNTSDRDTFFVDITLVQNAYSSGTGGNEVLRELIDGKDFFAGVARGIAVDNTVGRAPLAKPLEFRFLIGGEVLYNYINVNQGQLGITQLQSQTKYTNINGGLGLFSTRSSQERRFVTLHPATLDSLACGSVTGNLSFSIGGTSCF
ncbi:MAG: DUF4249 family protein [Chitinophagales bacterium]|nr:DUF4249 family protein [Chitinophagales bacterium]